MHHRHSMPGNHEQTVNAPISCIRRLICQIDWVPSVIAGQVCVDPVSAQSEIV